ncbi:M3 family metallopeptidase [Escherichia coli]
MRDRATREKLFIAGWTRAEKREKNDGNDTRAIIQRLVEIRAQQAKLSWFSSLCRMENRRSDGKNT